MTRAVLLIAAVMTLAAPAASVAANTRAVLTVSGGAGGGCGGVGVSSQATTTVPLGATVTTGTVPLGPDCRFSPSVCGVPKGRPGAAIATCTGVVLAPRRHATTARPVEVTPTPPSAPIGDKVDRV